GGDTVDRDGNPEAGEEPVETPEPRTGAVVVDRLHVPVALARPGLRAGNVREERLGGRVAMEDRVLAPLLVVQHERDGDLRAVRPACIGRGRAVAGHVAGIAVHEYLRSLRLG